jgi:hypothetical protein
MLADGGEHGLDAVADAAFERHSNTVSLKGIGKATTSDKGAKVRSAIRACPPGCRGEAGT